MHQRADAAANHRPGPRNRPPGMSGSNHSRTGRLWYHPSLISSSISTLAVNTRPLTRLPDTAGTRMLRNLCVLGACAVRR